MNAPLTPNAGTFDAPALPMPWVERIFQRMHGRFGNAFTEKFRVGRLDADGEDIGVLNAKAVWAEELAGYTPDELKRALAHRYAFPPSLDEFQRAARPTLDLQALLHLAIREMGNRRNRLPEHWPDCRTFWAAQRLGMDLLTWDVPKLQKRWELAWVEAAADASKPIPAATDINALPAPGKTTLSREEAQKLSGAIGLKLSVGGRSHEAQARRNLQNICNAPDELPRVTIEYALGALKFWHLDVPEKLTRRAIALGLLPNPDEVPA